MSWDLYIQDFGPYERIEDIPDDFKPLPIGNLSDIINKIRSMVPFADFDDPAWGVIETDEFSIEINVGDQECVDSIALHVRGGGDAAWCVADILKSLGLRAYDTGIDAFFDMNEPDKGFAQWRALRDKRMAEADEESG